MNSQLTRPETELLAQHERTIKNTRDAFVQCGKALLEIKRRKLYRERFSTFEDYCKIVWGWGRQRARLLINGAAMTEELPPDIRPLIQNERHARELSKLPKEDRAAILRRAAESGSVTGVGIVRASRENERKSADRAGDQKLPNANHGLQNFVDPERLAKSDTSPDLDDTRYPIPRGILPLWNRKSEVQEVLKAISKARSAVRDAVQKADLLYAPSNVSGAMANLNNAYTQMQVSVPYAVCPVCQGISPELCLSCKGRGFISKHHYDVCVPEELKRIRQTSCVAP